MKIREQIARIKNNGKGWKYGVAGTICLVAAVWMIAALFGNRADAQRINLTIEGRDRLINFEVVDGNYQVETVEQLKSLGNATTGTAGKTFVLANDLELGKVTNTAAGKFQGTFDGGGHVIKIDSADVSNETIGAGAQAEGILFGTVTGTVRNLIVDIEDEVSYERKSGLTPTEETKKEPLEMPSATYEEADEWSILDAEHADEAKAIAEMEEVYLPGGLFSQEALYKKEIVKQTTTERSFYPQPENTTMGEDAFGIICGKLDGGTISQVYIKGTEMTTVQDTETKNVPLETTVTTVQENIHYYKVEEKEKEFKKVDVEAAVGSMTVEDESGDEVDTEHITAELQKIVPDEGNPYYELKIKAVDMDEESRYVFTEVEAGWTIGDTDESWEKDMVLDSDNPVLTLKKETDQEISQAEFKVRREEPALKDEVSVAINGLEVSVDGTVVTGENPLGLSSELKWFSDIIPPYYTLKLEVAEGREFIFTEVPKVEAAPEKRSLKTVGEDEETPEPGEPVVPGEGGETPEPPEGEDGENPETPEEKPEPEKPAEIEEDWKIVSISEDGVIVESQTLWEKGQILDGSAPFCLKKVTTKAIGVIYFKLQEKYTKTTPLTVRANAGTVTMEDNTDSEIEEKLAVNLEKHESADGTVEYLLKFRAGELGEREHLKFTKVESGWTVVGTNDAWDAGTKLFSGETLTIRKIMRTGKTIKDVNFSVQRIRGYTAYTYEEGRTQISEPKRTSQSSDLKITYGNNLNAGAVAGISSGTIREVKLDIDVDGTSFQAASDSQTKGLELFIGTAAGKAAAGEMRALYLLSDADKTGWKDDSVTEAEIITSQDEKPDSENWKEYSYYTAKNTKTDSFDLAWLVKDAVFGTVPGTNGVTLKLDNPVRESQSIDYKTVYETRKKLSDAEFTKYYSSLAELPLGDGGYYRKNHVYATDGYYTYVKDYNTGTEEEPVYQTEYPYLNSVAENPVNLAGASVQVVRNQNTLDDQIVYSGIDLSKFDNRLRNSIFYYTVSADEKFTEEKGTMISIDGHMGSAAFSFDVEELKLYMTPSIDGKLYEISESPQFTRENRESLPQPQAVVSDDYHADGRPRTEKLFAAGAKYDTDSRVNLNFPNVASQYMGILNIAYAFTDQEQAPEASEKVWRKYAGAEFAIPSGLREDVDQYLHVKISKQFCDDVFVKFGPFKAVPGASVEPVFYYFDNTQADAYRVDGTTVFRGDVLRLKISGLNKKWKVVEYRINGNQWQEYTENSKIDLSGLRKDERNISIQLRMKRTDNGEDIYSAFFTFNYTLAGQTAPANSSPITTDTGMSGTSSILNSGTLIRLTSAASDARIFYTLSSDENASFNMERVLNSEEVDAESNEYRYFKVGKRWYRTSLTTAKEYLDTEPIEVENMSADRIRQYVHTVVLSENLEPSEEVTHEYLIEPMGTTAAPEASLETYTYPGNTSVSIASATRNSFLTFSSLTSGAEMYYTIDGTAPNDEVGGSTLLYDSKKGIKVEGVVGGTFTIKMKAVKYDTTTEDPNDKELLDSEIVTFTYKIEKQQEIPEPTAIPATNSDVPTVIVPGVKIILSSITKDSKIYYTTDGTSPQLEQQDDGTYVIGGASTYLYDAEKGIDAPTQQTGYFIIRAVAAKTNLAQSPEAEFVYQFPGEVLAPYANVSAGAVKKGTVVNLLSKTNGATIYYTISRDGTEPKEPTVSSSVFDEAQPFVIDSHTIIKALAVKNEVKSSVVTLEYICMEQLKTVTASIKSGSVVSGGTVLELNVSDASKIYYTLDGSDPTDPANTSVIIGKKVTLDGKPGDQITVKAYAKEEGKSDSEVVTFTYMISQSSAGVTADLPNGTYVSNGSKINLMTDVSDAEIYYTTDGSDPKTNGKEGSVVTVRGSSGASFMIKAAAKTDSGMGMVVTFTYRIKEKPSAPSAAPSGGTLTVATRVELSASVEKIYYTTDGTTPTESSALYKEPILINKTTTLQAIAVSEDGEVSDVSEFYYGAAGRAAVPTASAEDGSVLDPGTKVYLKTRTSGADIYYTTDGSDPELNKLDHCLVYTEEGISVQRSVVIKAVAYRENMQMSRVGTYSYLVEDIPAVELKKAEAEKLAKEGLQDTDASALDRSYQDGEKEKAERVLVNSEYNTRIESSEEAIPEAAVLVTRKLDPSSSAVREVKDRYGEDFAIISLYDIYVKSGSETIELEEAVELGIPVPADYSNAAVKVVCIGNDGIMRELPTRRESRMVYASTESFSNYALLGLKNVKEETLDINYLLIFEAAAGLTVVFGIGYFIVQKVKKYKKSKKTG